MTHTSQRLDELNRRNQELRTAIVVQEAELEGLRLKQAQALLDLQSLVAERARVKAAYGQLYEQLGREKKQKASSS